jgi:hypothetical protein
VDETGIIDAYFNDQLDLLKKGKVYIGKNLICKFI